MLKLNRSRSVAGIVLAGFFILYFGHDFIRVDTVTASTRHPEILEFVSSNMSGNSYVKKGIVILESSETSALIMDEFNPEDNNIQSKFIQKWGIPFYQISGQTIGNGVSFFSDAGSSFSKYVSVIVGDSFREPNTQISFSIVARGNLADYNLIYVNGPMHIFGWHGNNYYEAIPTNSSKLIDLERIIATKNDELQSLEKIEVVVQRNSIIRNFEFMIFLGKMTTGVPALLDGNQYFVHGWIGKGFEESANHGYTFHDFSFWEQATFRYNDIHGRYDIDYNGWLPINIFKQEEQNSLYDIQLYAERNIPLSNLPSEFFYQFNIYDSLQNIGPRDYLFLMSIISLLSVTYIFNKNWINS